MEQFVPAPERRFPSPSAQRRSGEHWKARFGLAMVVLLTLVSAALLFRLAGLGVGAAISPLRGQAAAPARPTAAATVPSTSGQVPGNVTAATPTGGPAAGAGTPAAGAPAGGSTATPASGAGALASPTTRPGQKEYVVQSGDSLFAIAQRNNTTVDALVAANNLKSRDVTLSVGQKLIIPA